MRIQAWGIEPLDFLFVLLLGFVIYFVYAPMLFVKYAWFEENSYIAVRVNPFILAKGTPLASLSRYALNWLYSQIGFNAIYVSRASGLVCLWVVSSLLYAWFRKWRYSAPFSLLAGLGFATLPATQVFFTLLHRMGIAFLIAALTAWTVYSTFASRRPLVKGISFLLTVGALLVCMGFYQTIAFIPLVMLLAPVLSNHEFEKNRERFRVAGKAILLLGVLLLGYYLAWRGYYVSHPQMATYVYAPTHYGNILATSFHNLSLCFPVTLRMFFNFHNLSLNWTWTGFVGLGVVIFGVALDGWDMARAAQTSVNRKWAWQFVQKYLLATLLCLFSVSLMLLNDNGCAWLTGRYMPLIAAAWGILVLALNGLSLAGKWISEKGFIGVSRIAGGICVVALVFWWSASASKNILLNIVLPAHTEYLVTIQEIREHLRTDSKIDYIEVHLNRSTLISDRQSPLNEFAWSNQTDLQPLRMLEIILREMGIDPDEIVIEVYNKGELFTQNKPTGTVPSVTRETAQHRLILDYTKFDMTFPHSFLPLPLP